jgi:hypothetical protein
LVISNKKRLDYLPGTFDFARPNLTYAQAILPCAQPNLACAQANFLLLPPATFSIPTLPLQNINLIETRIPW